MLVYLIKVCVDTPDTLQIDIPPGQISAKGAVPLMTYWSEDYWYMNFRFRRCSVRKIAHVHRFILLLPPLLRL